MHLDADHLEVDYPETLSTYALDSLLPGIPLAWLRDSVYDFWKAGGSGLGSRIQEEGKRIPVIVTLGGRDRPAQ